MEAMAYPRDKSSYRRRLTLCKIEDNKRYGHTAHTFSRLISNVLISEIFISTSNVFHMTDNDTVLVVSPANLISQQKQLITFVKLNVCHSVCLLVSYVNYP